MNENPRYTAYLCELPEEFKWYIRGCDIFINSLHYGSVDDFVQPLIELEATA